MKDNKPIKETKTNPIYKLPKNFVCKFKKGISNKTKEFFKNK